MAGTTSDTRRLLMRPASPSRFRTMLSSTTFTSSSLSLSSLRTYSTQPPRGPNNSVKFWPFLAIIGIGTAGYVLMIRARAENRWVFSSFAFPPSMLFVLFLPLRGSGHHYVSIRY
ncbi:hypothetical protein GGS26DRAFT_539068 [Hypomontagnella submonticulosa]|nr:hypothetical protein GGS26DRAFT_539068 [Hypomontagnella submonticulosa]